MDVRERLRNWHTVSWFTTGLIAGILAFPPSAYAVEVGCFCTFVFVSIMFVIGVVATLSAKYLLSKKVWKLSLKRTSLITFIEVVLLIAILFLLQMQYYIRVLVYLPLAFLLNYALTAAEDAVPQEQKTSARRATMAGLSCLVLPIAVQIMGWLATVLSELITFKEVRV
jgi:Ca2+/Na+ antiporter